MMKKLIAVSSIWVVGCMVLALLQACYSGSSAQTPENASQPKAVPVKPGASVSIRNTQPIKLETVGEQNIVVVLHSSSFPGEMSVSVAASKGVSILSTPNPLVYPLTESGEYRVPLHLNVEHEGRHYVRMNVSISSGGLSEKRVVSAILQVGEVRAKSQKAVPAASSGAVISLPAQERVSPRD